MYVTASVRNPPWIKVKLTMVPRQYITIESWVRPPLLLVINRSPSRYSNSSRPLAPLPSIRLSELSTLQFTSKHYVPSIIEDPEATSLPPLFDNQTSLPVEDVLPDLLDTFFHFYADNFCFLNRPSLDYLLSRGECSTFLICPMAAPSSRFCSPPKFAKYSGTKQDGSLREAWELAIPFLERAKSILIPLLGIPS